MFLVEGKAFIARQRQHCKDIDMSIFGFALEETQVDALYTLYYKQKYLLLLAKTSFGKSLIFQLLLFFLNLTSVVIILIPFKLF